MKSKKSEFMISKSKLVEFFYSPNSLKYYKKYMTVMGILGQLLFYLQGFKIFHDRSAEDVSLFGFLFGLLSVTSWLIYGLLIKDRVLIIANTFAVVGALFAIIGILIYGGTPAC